MGYSEKCRILKLVPKGPWAQSWPMGSISSWVKASQKTLILWCSVRIEQIFAFERALDPKFGPGV